MGLLRPQFRRQTVPQYIEERANLLRFLLPICGIHAKHFFQIRR